MISRKIFIAFSLFFVISCESQNRNLDTETKAILISQTGSSRATAYIDSNKIVETENRIFITYLIQKDDKQLIALKAFDKIKNEWTQEIVLDKVQDNHGGGSLIIDSKGYLHIVYGPHVAPFVYRKSTKPFDINMWEERVYIGTNMTYPSLAIDNNDKLYLLGRHSIIKGSWSLMVFYKDLDSKIWSKGKELIRSNYENWPKITNNSDDPKKLAIKNGYTRWNKSIAIDDQNNIHISFKNYEFLPRNRKFKFTNDRNGGSYFVGYLKSTDGGNTWLNNNKIIHTPAYPNNIKVVAGNNNPDNVTSNYGISNIALNSNGTPHFLYSKELENSSKLFLAYMGKDNWIHKEITLGKDDNDYLYCPSSISFYKDYLYIVATAMNKKMYDREQLWGEKQEYSLLKIIQMDSSYEVVNSYSTMDLGINSPSWLPSLSREDNYPPKLLFTQGGSTSEETNIYFNFIRL